MTRPRRRAREHADEGFTLLETIISIAMISVVTASLTMFYTQSNGSTAQQSQTQVANQLASTAMEQVSLLPGTALVFGRPSTCVSSQWTAASAVPGVPAYLAQMQQVSDVSLGSIACQSAQLSAESLPTTQTATSTVNGATMTFTQNFYVGLCWQVKPPATPPTTAPTPVACTKPAGTMPATMLPMLRVVIAVTWASNRCQANLCSFVTDTLMTQNLTDLTFEMSS
jgi:prepilin-type N-terminal cleavage/methylation domain-containing protein